MALTLQEIIAKRQSMGPNATNVEARQALMATPAVNPAPTTPIVPTPIPTQAPVIDQMAGKTVAERQAIRSGTPTPVTTPAPIAPVTPNTPPPVQNVSDTTPVQPAPVEVKAPVKPVTPTKTEAPIDYNQAQGREQEITTNVKGFIDSGMTPDQAKQASGYNEASPEKKAIIDGIITGASQGALLNEKDALNALISGVSVPKQNTQAFRNAEFKANKFRKFNSMTPTQLLDNLKMGEIGSEMDQLLSQNPNYAQAKQKLNELQKITNLNKTMSNLVTGAKGTEVPTITPEQDEEDISAKLMKKFGLDDANASAFAEFIATDEEMAENKAKLLVNKNQLSNVNRQIADATTLLNQGIKDLKTQYPDMSASGIITLMGSRLGEFNDAITNLNSTKTLLQADIKDEMDLAKSAYDAKSEDIKAQNTIRSNLALNEAKSLQEKADAEAALNDPATAIKSVMDEYKKLGIPFTSTVQSRLAEFKASGKPLEQFLTEMGQNIQKSPAYQKYQALQQGQMSDVQKMNAQNSFDLKKMAQQNNFDMQKLGVQLQASGWTKDASGNLVNPVTGQTFNGSISRASATGNIVPVTAGNKTVRLDQSGAGGFETAINQLTTAGIPIVVGQGARDQTATIKEMADRYGISFNASNPAETAQKLRSAGHQVADPGKSNHESGMAIDVYGSSKLDAVTPEQEKILNANGWYSANIPGDAGHFEYKGVGGTGTQGASSDAQNWFNLIQKGTTSYEDVMKKLGGTKVGQAVLQEINGLISSKGGAIPALPDSPQVKQMDTLLSTVKGLVDDPDAIENLSGFFQTSPLDAMTGKNDDTRSAIEFLVKGQTLQQLIDAKAQGATFGALSNEELKMLQNSANRLTSMIEFDETGKVKNFKGSEKTVKAELKKLLDTFTEKREKMINPGINKDMIPNQSVPVQTNTGVTNTGGGQTQTYQGHVIKPF